MLHISEEELIKIGASTKACQIESIIHKLLAQYMDNELDVPHSMTEIDYLINRLECFNYELKALNKIRSSLNKGN
jgi:hypothetical protein